MRWKNNVEIIRENGYTITMQDKSYPVLPEEEYLVRAIQKENVEDDELIQLIMDEKGQNEIVARLSLAGFLVKYQDFIARDEQLYMIL